MKFILLMCLSYSFWTCTNEDIVVRYPESTPKIDTVVVTETQITYGDSIHVKVVVSDDVAPLSTLLLKVVINTDVVASEVIRTKGNKSTVVRAYRVPFVANRPENAQVKLYLTLTNVTGIEEILITSNTVAKRPPIANLYLVPDFGQGSTVKLNLIDATNLIYKATGLTFGTSFNYKLATKIDIFKRIDWTGMVFGLVDVATGKIGLVDQTGSSINANDGTLVGISEFTFNALTFTSTVGGKLLEPVTTLDINSDLPPIVMSAKNFRGGNVYFGENVEVTFTGITTDLVNSISPDYFEIISANKAKFLGKTGLYKAYFLIEANYLYIEPQPETLYPDALWICGTGFGRPSSPYMTTASWNWNSPLDYIPCRLVSPGIYQATFYCKNTPNTGTGKYGGLDFKFFHKRGWWDGHEEWASGYTVSPPFLGPAETNGNVNVLSAAVVEGVYRFTLNTNNKTINAVKLP